MISNDVNTGEPLTRPIEILRREVEKQVCRQSQEGLPAWVKMDISALIAEIENAVRILKESEKAIF